MRGFPDTYEELQSVSRRYSIWKKSTLPLVNSAAMALRPSKKGERLSEGI